MVQLLVFICSVARWGWPWVVVFVFTGDGFGFYVFALVRWLSWGLCAGRVFVFLCIASGPGVGLAGHGSALSSAILPPSSGLFY